MSENVRSTERGGKAAVVSSTGVDAVTQDRKSVALSKPRVVALYAGRVEASLRRFDSKHSVSLANRLGARREQTGLDHVSSGGKILFLSTVSCHHKRGGVVNS